MGKKRVVAEGYKWCPSCKQEKPLAEFHANRNSVRPVWNSLMWRCKECHTAWARRYHMKRTYGITPEEYEQRLEEQGGVCAICGEPEPTPVVKVKRVRAVRANIEMLKVDHDHETGAVRSLLCSRCNGGLGGFRDRTDLLEKAIAYLKQHATASVTAQPAAVSVK